MLRSNLLEDYSLEGVTARLEAMKARRETRRNRKNEGPERQLSERKTACEFELGPADLSSGGSDTNSESGYLITSADVMLSDRGKAKGLVSLSQANIRRERAAKLRVTDSLDLSMSVAPSNGPSRQDSTVRDDQINTQVASAYVLSERAESKFHDSSQVISNKQYANIKPSRIPKLVQRRRKLQVDKRCAVVSEPVRAGKQDLRSVESPASFACKSNIDWILTENTSNIFNSTEKTLSQSSGSPTRAVPAPHNSSLIQIKETKSLGKVSFEVDFATAEEEQQLLQSLEKLDRRLSNASSLAEAMRESRRQGFNRKESLRTVVCHNTGNHNTSKSKPAEDTQRAAAHGGGTQCKLHRPASLSVRSSSAKRAELSSGVHKARVRVGGALVNDVGRIGTDASDNHKIVVKRELVHMLF